MAGNTVDTIFQLTFNLEGPTGGWQEKVWLGSADRATAVTDATKLYNARLACLSSALTMIWARVSEWGGRRDASAIGATGDVPGLFDGFLGTETPPATDDLFKPNQDGDSVMVRQESTDGQWSNRWVRGIIDKGILLDALTAAIPAITVAPTDPPPATNTFVQQLGGYLYWLKTLAVMCQIRQIGANIVRTTFPIAKITARKVAYRKPGRPFDLQRARATLR